MAKLLRKLTISAASVVGFLAVGEGAARGLAAAGLVDLPRPETVREAWARDGWELDRDLNWRLAPGATARWERTASVNSLGLRDVEFPVRKPAGELRVLVVGDSVVFGYGVPQEGTFAQRLEHELRAFGQRSVQVINAGVPGYSMYQVAHYLERDGFALDPDVIVVEANFNDRRYVFSEAFQDGADYYARFYDRVLAKERRARSYLYRAARRVAAAVTGRAGDVTDDGTYDYDSIDVTNAVSRVPPERHRALLDELLDRAAELGVPVVVLPIHDNPRHVRSYYAALERERAGNLEGALTALAPMQAIPFYRLVFARKRNELLRALGRETRVMDSIVPIDGWMTTDGNLPIELCDAYVEIQRAAAERDGVVLAELEPHDHPDRELYLDHIHPNAEGHELLGQLLLRTLLESPEIDLASAASSKD